VYPDAPTVINHFADANHHGGPWDGAKAIVLHHTGGTNSLAWLSTTPGSGVSVHVLIAKNGTVYRIVPDGKQAWHVGRSAVGNYSRLGSAGSPNECCLGIEIENRGNGSDPYTDAQYWSVGWVICQWWNAHGDLPVITHQLIDTQGKNDPYNFDVIRALRCAMAYYDH
jgi:N-acetylmuramoyl-L-alanine amidase